jgi:formate dehydrogenase subunit gamma
VRRDAAPAPPLSTEAVEQIDAAIARYRDSPGGLLEILHAIQARLNHVPPQSIPLIADALNLSRAEVYGVVTFYHYFRQKPAGRHVIRICQAEACRAMHCETLTAHAKAQLKVDFHETTADGRFSLEPVYCLGNCACSPAIMIDDDLHGRVTTGVFDQLVARVGAVP